MSHASIASDETISVRKQADYLDQIVHQSLREEARRKWAFWTHHAVDGYAEKAYYDIMLTRGSYIGQVNVSGEISDTALQNLRRKVVALF